MKEENFFFNFNKKIEKTTLRFCFYYQTSLQLRLSHLSELEYDDFFISKRLHCLCSILSYAKHIYQCGQ